MTKPFKIYIAGSDQQRARANCAFIELLRRVDLTVTALSLVSTVLSDLVAGETVSQRGRGAAERLAQIRGCDVFWLLIPPSSDQSAMPWIEMGYAQACLDERAHATRYPYLVFSGNTSRSIYCALDEEFETDEAAAEYIASLCTEAR